MIVREVLAMRSPHLVVSAAGLAVAALGACGGSTGPGTAVPPYVSLVTQATSYAPGALVAIELTNHTAFFIQAQTCGDVVLDKLTTSGWQPIPEKRACTDNIQGVDPNSTKIDGWDIPVNATAGTYRFRYEKMLVWPDGAPPFYVPAAQLVTNVFAVR
jgi:hypothetical protein